MNKTTEDHPVKSYINNKVKDEIVFKETISKSACRVLGIITDQSQNNSDLILEVTAFLGEGASFSTYRPQKGDEIKITGWKSTDYNNGDTLKVEIQTLPNNPDKPIQKVGLIKILDL